MKDGNWVPICKALVKYLPRRRPYSEVEAAYCLQCDYDLKKPVTVAGYSELWQWSRTRVRNFFAAMKISIEYPENTQARQNQKGQIAIQIQDRSETDTGQIRLIDNRQLQVDGDRYRTDTGQIQDRSRATTRDTKTKTNHRNTIHYQEIVAYLNEKTGKSFKYRAQETQRLIKARWNAGFRVDDFKAAVDSRCAKWLTDPAMVEYLRPSTLFGTKMESYIQQNKPQKKKRVPAEWPEGEN